MADSIAFGSEVSTVRVSGWVTLLNAVVDRLSHPLTGGTDSISNDAAKAPLPCPLSHWER
jgi:hypothetical protein